MVEAVKDRGKKMNDEYRPVVRNLLLLCKEYDAFEDVENGIEARYDKNTEKKNSKLGKAHEILKTSGQEYDKALGKFLKQYNISGYQPNERLKKEYLTNYLVHVKYLLRKKGLKSGGNMVSGKEGEES